MFGRVFFLIFSVHFAFQLVQADERNVRNYFLYIMLIYVRVIILCVYN